MTSTAMSSAFEKAGVSPALARLKVALARYQNQGGGYEAARAALDAAYGISGGHGQYAREGHSWPAPREFSRPGGSRRRATAPLPARAKTVEPAAAIEGRCTE